MCHTAFFHPFVPGRHVCFAIRKERQMTTSPLCLSPEYLLLKQALACIQRLSDGEEHEILALLEKRLRELSPTDPVLEPVTANIFSCEPCNAPLHVVRIARFVETLSHIITPGHLI